VKTKLLTLWIIVALIFLFCVIVFLYDFFLEYKISFSIVFISALIYLLVQQLQNIGDAKKIIYMSHLQITKNNLQFKLN